MHDSIALMQRLKSTSSLNDETPISLLVAAISLTTVKDSVHVLDNFLTSLKVASKFNLRMFPLECE